MAIALTDNPVDHRVRCWECGELYDSRHEPAHEAVCGVDDDPAFLAAQDEWPATQVGIAAGRHV